MRTLRGIRRMLRAGRASNPNARPATAVAEQRKASTSYLQKLRNCVCQVASVLQREPISSLPRAPGHAAVLEISFAETEVKVSLPVQLLT